MIHHKPQTVAKIYLKALRSADHEIMFSRQIDNLFEMGNGDEVVKAIMNMATPYEKSLMLEFNGKDNFEEWTAIANHQLVLENQMEFDIN